MTRTRCFNLGSAMPLDGLQYNVDTQKLNTRMLCAHLPKREPMVFIRFLKGHLTPKILGTIKAKRRNFIPEFTCEFPREGNLRNETVAHNLAKAEREGGDFDRSFWLERAGRGVLSRRGGDKEAPAASLKRSQNPGPSNSRCSCPCH